MKIPFSSRTCQPMPITRRSDKKEKEHQFMEYIPVVNYAKKKKKKKNNIKKQKTKQTKRQKK